MRSIVDIRNDRLTLLAATVATCGAQDYLTRDAAAAFCEVDSTFDLETAVVYANHLWREILKQAPGKGFDFLLKEGEE